MLAQDILYTYPYSPLAGSSLSAAGIEVKRRGGQRWRDTQAPGAPGVRQEGKRDGATGGGRDMTGQRGERLLEPPVDYGETWS